MSVSVLYHASPIKSLKTIKPRRTISHNKYIGDYLFATANKKLAIMYLVPRGIPILMQPNGPHPNVVICSNPDEFKRQDKGGAVYDLDSKDFVESPQKDLEAYEKVSTHAVNPIGKTLYTTVIEALQINRIEIHFVDKDTFQNLIKNPEQERIIQSLETYSL